MSELAEFDLELYLAMRLAFVDLPDARIAIRHDDRIEGRRRTYAVVRVDVAGKPRKLLTPPIERHASRRVTHAVAARARGQVGRELGMAAIGRSLETTRAEFGRMAGAALRASTAFGAWRTATELERGDR